MSNKTFFFLAMLMIGFFLGAAVPNMIPIQGTLTDSEGNIIDDDAAEVSFAIYDAETDGTELWHETRTLLIDQGRLSVYLGEIEPITYEKIGGKDALWLEIGYDGEVMNRIRLASVPFAMEAAVAHNAEQVGKYSEQRLDDMFSRACDSGSFLRGWSGSTPICELDKEGEGGTGSYTAGKGIVINGQEISVEESLFFQAGDGIEIVDGTISVNGTRYALVNHNHDLRYYRRNEDIVHEHDMTVNGLFVAGSDATVNGDLTVDQNATVMGDFNVQSNATVRKEFNAGGMVHVKDGVLSLGYENPRLVLNPINSRIDSMETLRLNGERDKNVTIGSAISSGVKNNLTIYGNPTSYTNPNTTNYAALAISTGTYQEQMLLDDQHIDSVRNGLQINKKTGEKVYVGGRMYAEKGIRVTGDNLDVESDLKAGSSFYYKGVVMPLIENATKVISTNWRNGSEAAEKTFSVTVPGGFHTTDKSAVIVNVCESVNSTDPTCKYGTAKDKLIVTEANIYLDGSTYKLRLRIHNDFNASDIDIAVSYMIITPQ